MHPAFVSTVEFAHKHKKWEAIIFFIAGFAFDATLLHRIDDPLMLVHQAIYLSFCAGIIAWDLFGDVDRAEVPAESTGRIPKFFKKLWSYREGILHFMLGTLLNVYTIFYFKSGTILSSLIFLALLASLLFLNETRPANIPKHLLRNALFSLCLISYLNVVVSIVVGSIGLLVFIAGLAVAAAIHSFFSFLLKRKLDPQKIRLQVQSPFWGILFIYGFLYFFKVLPPVPLSVKHIGIYHNVTRVDGGYQLEMRRPNWKFWESGDQTFEAQPGDKLFCFVQIFAPSRFHDQLKVRWRFHDPRAGWTVGDAIPLGVSGGREDGFRGFTSKSNYEPGDWRVEVETSDGREIGRINFTVESATSQTNDTPRYEIR
jgi:hypothetical protein